MQLLIIVNPISGRSSKKSVIREISSHIDMRKYEVTIRFTSYSGHATELATVAVREGVDVVVAVGGDGTVNEVAKALAGSQAVLGIIPCGSGNGLARHLHIPMNVRKAIDIINSCDVETIDTLTVNGMPCFCTAGVGYDAHVSEEYSKAPGRGLVTYVKKAVGEWFSYEPQEYIIKSDDRVIQRRALTITCANANQWGNGFHVAPKASLKDGLIDVTIIHPIKLINAIPMPLQILGYSFDRNPDVECFKTSKLLIKRRNNNAIHIDGEPIITEKDLRIEMRHASLKVIIKNSITI